MLASHCADQQCRPHGAQDCFSTAWGRRPSNQFGGNGTHHHRSRSAQRTTYISNILGKVLSSLHWIHLLHTVISTNAPVFISLQHSAALSRPDSLWVYARKGQRLQTTGSRLASAERQQQNTIVQLSLRGTDPAWSRQRCWESVG